MPPNHVDLPTCERRHQRRGPPRGMLRRREAAVWSGVRLRTWATWESAGLVPRPENGPPTVRPNMLPDMPADRRAGTVGKSCRL
jgi:hypothetical protein